MLHRMRECSQHNFTFSARQWHIVFVTYIKYELKQYKCEFDSSSGNCKNSKLNTGIHILIIIPTCYFVFLFFVSFLHFVCIYLNGNYTISSQFALHKYLSTAGLSFSSNAAML